MFDVFISYRRDGGSDFARMLYNELKQRGLNVFFDYEELNEGLFNEKLYQAIEKSKNFIVVLSPNALDRCVNEDDWVKLEIFHAMNIKKCEIIPVRLPGFEYPDNLGDISDFKYIQAVTYSRFYHPESVDKVLHRLKNVQISDEVSSGIEGLQEVGRVDNKYITDKNRLKEIRRLGSQKRILKNFDSEVYERVLSEIDDLTVLDVGSNRGDLVMDRIGKTGKLNKLLGIEYDEALVSQANDKYGIDGRIEFFQADVEADDFSDKLEEYMYKMQIEKFNVIHISMLLLHLSKPFNVLKTVKKYMAKGGIIIIKDIDDGMNLAYPDDNNDFKRVIDMCKTLETSGFRHCGRQIYTLLKRTGYRDVRLEKTGLHTMEMDFDDREALFDTYFSFILEDSEIMMNRHPENRQYAENYEWLRDNYDSLEERFQDTSFFFNLGFMIFTARK